jgi:hypothetical protein
MRRALGSALALGLWLLTTAAPARPIVYQSCFNDTDCAGPECGGPVCDWNQLAPGGDPAKPYLCVSAGSGPKGQEGWCTASNGDANCKCRDLGAKCVGVYCTFTHPQDAPSGGGGSASAGAPSVAGGSAVGGAPAQAGSGPVPEPPGDVSHEDTKSSPRTSRACSLSTVGRDADERYLAALAGLAAGLAAYRRKGARIPR